MISIRVQLRLALVMGAVCVPRAARAQCPDGTPPPCARAPVRAPAAHSVAVLYLADLSRDTANAYLADGLTEDLIARLSRVSGLEVASRFASLRYRGHAARDPRFIGRDLGVRYLLDGTLRRAGDRLHIVLEMTDAARGFNVWGQTYERPLDHLLALEDTIAAQIADAVLGRRSGAAPAPAAPAVRMDAYQAFLQARVAIRARTADAAALAIRHYRAAIEMDPGFARAWAGLAVALALARDWGWQLPGIPVDSVQPLAAAAAARALALDSTSGEAWLAEAMAERATDVHRALTYHRRSVALDSANVETWHQLAWGFLGTGELDSAVRYERAAIAQDPFYAYAYAGLAEMLNDGGRPQEALEAIAEGRAVDSLNAPLFWQTADADLHLGRPAQARVAAARAAALGFDPVGVRILQALAQIVSGDTTSADSALAAIGRDLEAEPAASRGGLAYTNAGLLSGAYARLGRVDASIRWAEQVAQWPRRFYAVMFAHHWYWEPIRGDPRFSAFVTSLRR